jgi:acyl carrier protein
MQSDETAKNEEEILEKLKALVIDRLNVEEEQIKPDASFVEDLGADSLDIVELIMGIEEEFEVEIPDEDAEKLKNVGDALAYVRKRLGVGAEE